MEDNNNSTAPESTFQIFDSAEALQNSLPQEPVQDSVQEPVQESVPETNQDFTPEPTQTPEQEPVSQEQPQQTFDAYPDTGGSSQEYSQDDIESAVAQYLSERLNLELNSLDDLQRFTQQSQLDERIEKIAQFVQNTGRDPEDWFRYQTLNPSEMDDVTSVRIQMTTEYPNLSQEEINTFLKSKYKLDSDVYDEDDARIAQLQLKIDAQKARETIDSIRQEYSAPMSQQSQPTSFIDQNWISNMASEVQSIDGFEFDLGNGNSFTFGLNDQYKGQLMNKATQFDKFFDGYVMDDGSWDYEAISAHQTVIDNIDSIVKNAYQKGLGDGQKSIVQKTANASSEAPQQTQNTQSDPVIEQLKRAKFGDSSQSFLSF